MELRVIEHGVVDSSSERAFAAIEDGTARDGDLHVAAGQTSGRGRRGASWHSPEGSGLYLSVVLAPEVTGEPSAEAPSLAGALAVLDTLTAAGVSGLALKWPNDLLLDGAKLCGVLVESRGYDPARPRLVLGIGINVGTTEFPAELTAERPVTSLALAGHATTPSELLARLLPHLAARLRQGRTDPERLARDYADASGWLGTRVRVEAGGGRAVEGTLAGFSLAAGVEVRGDDGQAETIALGHVRAVRPL